MIHHPMPLICVASLNPVKIEAALAGFRMLFPGQPWEAIGRPAPSGVPEQPLGDEETLLGALNRARAAQQMAPEAAWWVGIEGGILWREDRFEAFAWVAVWDGMRQGTARTAAFSLPPAVADLIRAGLDLGQADDQIFGTVNSKQQNGAVGLLTGDAITRSGLYTPAVVMALIPFRNPDLYP
ncbi:MAG: inosine/xanthosine triphosphatase [Bacteroidia bacterium]|nr:inosine/xanthosine triphosphatase [Bacteroidia bacterium]